MRLNREKVVFGASLIILLVHGVYSMVNSQIGTGVSYRKIPDKLNQASPELLQIDPRLIEEDGSGSRNPFHFASDWADLPPTPMLPPPIMNEARPQILFGFLNERQKGQEITYKENVPTPKVRLNTSSKKSSSSAGSGSPLRGTTDGVKGGSK